MSTSNKVTANHLSRSAYLYVRQSTLRQVYENRESTARQYDLKRRAQAMGWNSDQIVVIDEDLGLSGASAADRNGFQRLVAEVGLGRVGLVMGLEVSRLARSSTDWHRLLEICALSDTLILDEDGIYDPSQFNDRLLLGLKGTMSEAELHILRARLLGGQLNKARRGELWMLPPIGFVYDPTGKMILDPDQQIQHSLNLLFETFHRSGTAERVVRYFSCEQIQFPRRINKGARKGDIVFVPLEHHRVLHILHNPRYSGAYVYGRTRQRKVLISGQPRYRRLPQEDWKVFIPNAFPGYISWEQFQLNQARLRENANKHGGDRRRTPPQEGSALLQGLVICGACGKRMTVRYYVRKGHPTPDYLCQRKGIETAQRPCQIIPGAAIDEVVAETVLASVTPASLEIALQVFDQMQARKAELDRIRQAQIQRIREDVELAQRQFMLVRPENRLVADALERQWNEKLALLAKAEEEHQITNKVEGSGVSADDRNRILALASDLPQVWKNPRTSARDRKRMLRLMIEDVTLIRSDKIQIQIRWKGGATTVLNNNLPLSAPELFKTPAAIVEQIRALSTNETDSQIASTLNNRWLRSGRGKHFTRNSVRSIRLNYGIRSFSEHLRKEGWLTSREMAGVLDLHVATVIRFGLEGVLQAVRATDRGDILYAPMTGPLPKAHPGKRFKDRRRYPQCAVKERNRVQHEA